MSNQTFGLAAFSSCPSTGSFVFRICLQSRETERGESPARATAEKFGDDELTKVVLALGFGVSLSLSLSLSLKSVVSLLTGASAVLFKQTVNRL